MAKAAVTILAGTPEEYAERIDRIKGFAKHIHVDVADGVFAPSKTIGLAQVYDIDGARFDIHLMLQRPAEQIQTAISLEPDLVTLHFESDGDLASIIEQLQSVGIKAGLALKTDTTVDQAKDLIARVDHVLIFTGTLGFNGGDFQGHCLDKIQQAKAIKADLEVGVDGGIDQANGRLAIDAGADILYAGSFVHESADPEAAYIGLNAIASGGTA